MTGGKDGTRYCRHGHPMARVGPDGKWLCRTCQRRWNRNYREKQRAAKVEQRRRDLKLRRGPPRRDCVWTAGQFEGEGTVTLVHLRRGDLVRPQVSLTSTDREVIDYLHERWPGTLCSRVPNRDAGRSKRAFNWQLQNKSKIEEFLMDIRPYIVTSRVRAKVDLILEDIRDRAFRCRRTDVMARTRERLARIREMNRRGVRGPEEQRPCAIFERMRGGTGETARGETADDIPSEDAV